MKEICFECGKLSYDKKGAETVRNIRHKAGSDRLRIYPCDNCKGWHLTKKL